MIPSGVYEIITQRIGRWESFAFSEYIREPVEIFTYGVSRKMLDNDHWNEKNLPRQDRMKDDSVEHIYEEGEGTCSGILFTNYLQKEPDKDGDPYKS